MEVILDGELMTDRPTVHDLLSEKLAFPEYYGRNLDALYDLLSTYPVQVNFVLIHENRLYQNLGNYGKSLLRTLQDAAVFNSNVKFAILSEKNKNNS